MFDRKAFLMPMSEVEKRFFLDKVTIQKIVTEQNAQMGFVPDPTATAEKAQALVAASLAAKGIRPEDNVFSCGIIAAREE